MTSRLTSTAAGADDGRELLQGAWDQLVVRGAGAMRVVSAQADEPKVEMLIAVGRRWDRRLMTVRFPSKTRARIHEDPATRPTVDAADEAASDRPASEAEAGHS